MKHQVHRYMMLVSKKLTQRLNSMMQEAMQKNGVGQKYIVEHWLSTIKLTQYILCWGTFT
jgi:hypothetical protein